MLSVWESPLGVGLIDSIRLWHLYMAAQASYSPEALVVAIISSSSSPVRQGNNSMHNPMLPDKGTMQISEHLSDRVELWQ